MPRRSWMLLAALAVTAVVLLLVARPSPEPVPEVEAAVAPPPAPATGPRPVPVLRAVPPPEAAAPTSTPAAAAPKDLAAAPIQFPANAPAAHTPRGFPQLVQEVAQSCGMSLQVTQVDCDEYPCIAWLSTPAPLPQGFSVSRCKAWTDAFSTPARTAAFERDGSGGNTEQVFALYAVPAEKELAAAGETRAAVRLERVRSELDLRKR